jgi:diguanylate cyclase (GGDEF)-like protein
MDRPGMDIGEGCGAAVGWADRDESGRRAMLADILAQVSREALQGDGLEAVLRQIVDSLIRQLPVAVASIILLDDGGDYFVQEVSSGALDLNVPAGLTWPVTVGAAGRCARTGRAQLIVDVEGDPDYVAGNHAVRSEYLVPIRHRDRLHGVLNLESTHADFFDGDVCAVFDAVALQIGGAIHLARLVRELEQANRRLQQLSMSDGLTGIANRRCFDLQLAADWARLADQQRSLALLLVDADHFKRLNDARGHLYGDECLRELARTCTRVADGEEDLVARYGGDELVLLLPGRTQAHALDIGENLRRAVESAGMDHPASATAGIVTVSVGVAAAIPLPRTPAECLIAAADLALYAAKARKRNCVVAGEVTATAGREAVA